MANTAGKRFFATGGGTHLTEDDLLIGQEIGDRKKRVIELEKERKKRLDFYQKCDAALIVLDHLEHNLDSDVNKLCKNDLKNLLMWKGVSGFGGLSEDGREDGDLEENRERRQWWRR